MSAPPRTPRPPIEEWPWYKNPYLWAFVIGAVLLTLLRPCTRYEPEPLPSLGEIPAWMSPREPMIGAIAFVLFEDPTCTPCAEAMEGALYVMRRLERSDILVDLYVYHPGEQPNEELQRTVAYESRVHFQSIAPPDDWHVGPFDQAAVESDALPQDWEAFLQLGTVWILDPNQQLRGPFQPLTTDERSALFYRTQHVLDALRANKDKDS